MYLYISTLLQAYIGSACNTVQDDARKVEHKKYILVLDKTLKL